MQVEKFFEFLLALIAIQYGESKIQISYKLLKDEGLKVIPIESYQTKTRTQCEKGCSGSEACLSINFFMENSTCALNRETRELVGHAKMVKRPNMWYGEKYIQMSYKEYRDEGQCPAGAENKESSSPDPSEATEAGGTEKEESTPDPPSATEAAVELDCPNDLPPETIAYPGTCSCFVFYSSLKTWAAAQSFCNSLDDDKPGFTGNLAKISDYDSLTIVLFGGGGGWIGVKPNVPIYNISFTPSEWEWVRGNDGNDPEPVTYYPQTNYFVLRGYRCVIAYVGNFQDEGCNESNPYICELVQNNCTLPNG